MMADLPDGTYTMIDKETGRTTIVNQNGELQSAIEVVNENTVNHYDAQNNLTKTVTKGGNFTTTDEFETRVSENGDKQSVRTKQTEIIKLGAITQTITTEYAEDGQSPLTRTYSMPSPPDFLVKEEFFEEDGKQFVTATKGDGTVQKFEIVNGTRVEIKDEVPEEQVVEQQPEPGAPQEGAVKNTDPTEYTVPAGKNFTTLIKESLIGQGIENPTQEQIDAEIARFKELNPGAVKTNKKGVDYLIAGAKVQIAGGLENQVNDDLAEGANVLNEIVVTAKVNKNDGTPDNNIIQLKGADPETGKVGDKEYTKIKGHGMCKYDPELKGYKPFTGVYDGQRYENGQFKGVAINGCDPVDGKFKGQDIVKVNQRLCRYNPDIKGYEYYTGVHNGQYYEKGQPVNAIKKNDGNTYTYRNGSITKGSGSFIYQNAKIKIGDRTFEMDKGQVMGSTNWGYNDFVEEFMDPKTGTIRAKSYATNTYYLTSGNLKFPVNIDPQTKALIVDINGQKVDFNTLMSGAKRIK